MVSTDPAAGAGREVDAAAPGVPPPGPPAAPPATGTDPGGRPHTLALSTSPLPQSPCPPRRRGCRAVPPNTIAGSSAATVQSGSTKKPEGSSATWSGSPPLITDCIAPMSTGAYTTKQPASAPHHDAIPSHRTAWRRIASITRLAPRREKGCVACLNSAPGQRSGGGGRPFTEQRPHR